MTPEPPSRSSDPKHKRRFFVPEVIQTSAMDCGPASLKALLGGHGIHVNYDRLRERCQTDVDGTSVAALETLSQQLGLDAQTIIVPLDTLLMKDAESLPAIVVTNSGEGYHFVVVWSIHGDYLQIMDPGVGRSFVRKDRFLERVAAVTLKFEQEAWRDWAETGSDAVVPLRAKIRSVGASEATIDRLFERASADPSWETFATLDAAVRMVRSLVDSKAIGAGDGAAELVSGLLDESLAARRSGAPQPIPDAYWTVFAEPSDEGAVEQLFVTGAVIVYVAGVFESAGAAELAPLVASVTRGRLSVAIVGSVPGRRSQMFENVSSPFAQARQSRLSMWSGHVMPKTLVDDLRANEVKPARLFWDIMRLDAGRGLHAVFALAVVSVLASTVDVLMMRGLSDLLSRLALASERLHVVLGIVAFLLIALVLEGGRELLAHRIGRGLETRLRVSFLEKLPKLEDRYLRTRPLSDMASRAHLLQTLRQVPSFAVHSVATVLDLFVTAGLLIWVYPQGWWMTMLALVVSMTVPVVAYRAIDDQFGKIATHGGSLFRFYLDALLGVVPVRVHGAERVIRRQHEGLLAEWGRSSRTLQGSLFFVNLVEGLIGAVITVGLVYAFIVGGGPIQKMLILVYFAQRIPSIGAGLVGTLSSYPALKHNALRLFEPLGAAETRAMAELGSKRHAKKGVRIDFNDVEVVAGGNAVLNGLDLAIEPGTHVGIVGSSGAGKSSLLSVLLGWLTPTAGRVSIDGRPLDMPRLARLREEIAWVDPGIQLWNTNVLENLMYGSKQEAIAYMQEALHRSDVIDVLERLPDGLLSELGEGGATVSGGQGQRIRFARALMKPDARLVILDEPFRGLERDRRQKMLARAREYWKDATILFVSHDVSDTVGLDRILVVDQGHVVEDGSPDELLETQGSRYRALVEADRDVRAALWKTTRWRRVRIDKGQLIESPATEGSV